MSVKKKDRHLAMNECLNKSRELMKYILILTRPREYDEEGKQIQKPGLLGEGQPLQAFGYDILLSGKRIHAACYETCGIKLRKMKVLWQDKKITTEDLQKSYAGWRASISKGTTFYIVQNMNNYFRSLFEGVEIIK